MSPVIVKLLVCNKIIKINTAKKVELYYALKVMV
jgi:hypothetical protein